MLARRSMSRKQRLSSQFFAYMPVPSIGSANANSFWPKPYRGLRARAIAIDRPQRKATEKTGQSHRGGTSANGDSVALRVHVLSTSPRLRALVRLTWVPWIPSWGCLLRERIVRSVVCSHLDHMFCPDGLELSLFVIRYTLYTYSRAPTYTYCTCTVLPGWLIATRTVPSYESTFVW